MRKYVYPPSRAIALYVLRVTLILLVKPTNVNMPCISFSAAVSNARNCHVSSRVLFTPLSVYFALVPTMLFTILRIVFVFASVCILAP